MTDSMIGPGRGVNIQNRAGRNYFSGERPIYYAGRERAARERCGPFAVTLPAGLTNPDGVRFTETYHAVSSR